MNRPATSQSRGTCRYYTTPRGCFAGDKCKFTHADPQQAAAATSPILTPYDRAKRCKYYANGMSGIECCSTTDRDTSIISGFCKRGENCWFLHVIDSPREAESDEDELCSICFERPTTFGLLSASLLSRLYCLGYSSRGYTAGCSHVFCVKV
jgi:E3 ubiquitin-protein ligase makorin